ncbi:centrosomal protein of 89 kDa isoform X2 [Cololabis saira]|uniref:centrosomal protein of 89 kDa isoform X2 n=1 Tax=Cololabis saira TaxID=129043 RepID=UPI002AD282AE|nr:centrosomal protein of 89 kDa isoform X2 [Cololabis saira]
MFKKFNFRRGRDKDFKHIAHGLIPAASIAPKAAVPRTPPPRSPNPSPERPRSALAAAILSSSLTGQTWAIPPVRPRSFSEFDRSESFISEPNFNTHYRDRWSEDLDSRPRLSSPDQSEGEFEDREEELESEEDEEEHVYQTLERENFTLPKTVRDLGLKTKSGSPPPAQMSARRVPSPDLTEGSSVPSPEAPEERASAGKSPDDWKDDVPYAVVAGMPPIPSNDRGRSPRPVTRMSAERGKLYSEVRREKKTRMMEEQKHLEERLQRLEQEISHSQASSNPRSSAGSQAELQSLRRHAQELVDENDALKLTVHRLNVELSRYQARFRPLSQQELDMKYLCPLLLAYEDRMSEKDALLKTTEEEVKKLRSHVEEVVKENERLHDEITNTGAVGQKDSQLLQQQALLVLQENQVLIDQLEAQHVKAKANHSRHETEVLKVTKQLMLLEAERERLQEELAESRREEQRLMKEVQTLQTQLKDSITWDEHCHVAAKLRRQLEQQESCSRSEREELLLRNSRTQEENRSLALDKANLAAEIKTVTAELERCKQANRSAERKMSTLKKQREACLLQEESTRHYLGAVISVTEIISKDRDQLLHTASALQEEKDGFTSRIMNGTARFGKLQQDVKEYRSKASSRLTELQEALQGREASYRREILHLQRLLGERQEAEEKLLQSRRDLEEELETVWQAATRENRRIREDLLDSGLGGALGGRGPEEGPASPGPAPAGPAPQEATPSQHQQKHGLDFYC